MANTPAQESNLQGLAGDVISVNRLIPPYAVKRAAVDISFYALGNRLFQHIR